MSPAKSLLGVLTLIILPSVHDCLGEISPHPEMSRELCCLLPEAASRELGASGVFETAPRHLDNEHNIISSFSLPDLLS